MSPQPWAANRPSHQGSECLRSRSYISAVSAFSSWLEANPSLHLTKKTSPVGTLAQVCHPRYSESWGRRIIWAQEFETSLNKMRPISLKKKKKELGVVTLSFGSSTEFQACWSEILRGWLKERKKSIIMCVCCQFLFRHQSDCMLAAPFPLRNADWSASVIEALPPSSELCFMQLTVYWWTQWYFPALVAQQQLISYSAVIWYMDTQVCRRDAEKSDHGSRVYKVWCGARHRCATTEAVEQEISWAQHMKPAWVTTSPPLKTQDILLDNYNPHFFLSKSSQFARLHCTGASFFLHLHQSSLMMAAKKQVTHFGFSMCFAPLIAIFSSSLGESWITWFPFPWVPDLGPSSLEVTGFLGLWFWLFGREANISPLACPVL